MGSGVREQAAVGSRSASLPAVDLRLYLVKLTRFYNKLRQAHVIIAAGSTEIAGCAAKIFFPLQTTFFF